ncbi:MAG TPA: hypothetical protein VM509_12640 [Planctomycetota bacterium]|nr:hypothetical protein [Planctomycetota bacterium]
MIHSNSIGRLASHVVLAAALVACSSIDPYEKNRELLVAAAKNLAADKPALAAQEAEQLYAGRAGEAEQFRVQRYYALVLLTEAHVQAATHEPFLKSGDSAPTSSIGAAHNSDVPHLVAATYYAGLAHDLAPSLAKAPAVVDGKKLLPPELEAVPIQDAQEKLELIRLVALSRLGFATTYQRELENRTALQQPKTCDELIARVGLEKELVPWIYYTLFQYLKNSKESAAYLFGAKARLAAASTSGAIPTERVDEIVAWLKEKSSKVVFCCQVCGKPFPFEKLSCVNDPTKITEFTPRAP